MTTTNSIAAIFNSIALIEAEFTNPSIQEQVWLYDLRKNASRLAFALANVKMSVSQPDVDGKVAVEVDTSRVQNIVLDMSSVIARLTGKDKA